MFKDAYINHEQDKRELGWIKKAAISVAVVAILTCTITLMVAHVGWVIIKDKITGQM